MNREVGLPLVLIYIVGCWAVVTRHNYHPFGAPAWVGATFNAAAFVMIAVHIWRGRGWR